MSRTFLVTVASCLALTGALLVAGQRQAGPAAPTETLARFVDVASIAGVTFQHVNGASPERHLHEIMSGGGLFFDYDNDGWLDVFLVDGGSLTDPAIDRTARHRLYRNRGNGTFQDATASSGIARTGYGMGACAADVNNDGWIDLYVTSVGPNALYQNNAGKGKAFTDVTKASGVAGAPLFSASCAFGDVDRDGDVDLFVVNYVDARLDNNIFCGDVAEADAHLLSPAELQAALERAVPEQRQRHFHRRQRRLRHRLTIAETDSAWCWATTTMTGAGRLRRQRHDAEFPVSQRRQGPLQPRWHCDPAWRWPATGGPRAGMGTDFADYDGDGDLDLFVTNHELETHTLYRNLGKGLFSEVTVPEPASAHRRFPLSGLAPRSSITTTTAISTSAS